MHRRRIVLNYLFRYVYVNNRIFLNGFVQDCLYESVFSFCSLYYTAPQFYPFLRCPFLTKKRNRDI